MKYEKWIPVLSLAGCYIEVTYFPVLSLAGRYPLMQVRWVDQTQYPMIVVASLSAVPQSCRTPLPNQYLDCMLLAVYTHTDTNTCIELWTKLSPHIFPDDSVFEAGAPSRGKLQGLALQGSTLCFSLRPGP